MSYNVYKNLKFSYNPIHLKNKSKVRVKHPINLRAARRIGYKNKLGYFVFHIKVKKGSKVTTPVNARRRSKSYAPRKTLKISNRRIAENRISRQYKSLELLNSYKICEKTRYNYYQAILYDPIIFKNRKLLPGKSFRGITSSCRN
jgi:ribosomal protein L15E